MLAFGLPTFGSLKAAISSDQMRGDFKRNLLSSFIALIVGLVLSSLKAHHSAPKRHFNDYQRINDFASLFRLGLGVVYDRSRLKQGAEAHFTQVCIVLRNRGLCASLRRTVPAVHRVRLSPPFLHSHSIHFHVTASPLEYSSCYNRASSDEWFGDRVGAHSGAAQERAECSQKSENSCPCCAPVSN